MTEIKHTSKSFDLELAVLKGKLSDMFLKTESQIDLMIRILAEGGQTSIETLIQSDEAINDLCSDIDRMTVTLLALQQPVAVDLRRVIGSLKISTDIERIADYCVNIGKQIAMVKGEKTSRSMESIIELAEKAQNMVSLSSRAFLSRDAKQAQEVIDLDDDVDSQYALLVNHLQEEMAQNSGLIEACSHLLYIARHLERVADHAVNIGQHVKYIATGRRDSQEEG